MHQTMYRKRKKKICSNFAFPQPYKNLYDNGDGTTKLFREFNGAISLSTIERWCRRICEVSTINLVNLRKCSRTIRTKAAIQKINRQLNRRKPLSFLNSLVNWIFLEVVFREYSRMI